MIQFNNNNHETTLLSSLMPNRKPYEGFWGTADYFWNGGIENGVRYNKNGEALGLAPVTGMGAMGLIVGPLRKGQKALRIGKYLINPTHFHRMIKPSILSKVSDFSRFVGKNPDISIDGFSIILRGAKNGPFKGKTFKTGLNILEFLELL